MWFFLLGVGFKCIFIRPGIEIFAATIRNDADLPTISCDLVDGQCLCWYQDR